MSAHDYFVNHLATLNAAPNRLTYLGRSLGGAAAAWVAKSYKPKQLLLQSTFANLADTAANGYPLAGGSRLPPCSAPVPTARVCKSEGSTTHRGQPLMLPCPCAQEY